MTSSRHCVSRRRITRDTKTIASRSARRRTLSCSLFLFSPFPPFSPVFSSSPFRLHLLIVKTTTYEDSDLAWPGLCFASFLSLALVLSHFPHFPLSILHFICLLPVGPSSSGRSGVATTRKMGSIWVSQAHAARAERGLDRRDWPSRFVHPFFLFHLLIATGQRTRPLNRCWSSSRPGKARPFPSSPCYFPLSLSLPLQAQLAAVTPSPMCVPVSPPLHPLLPSSLLSASSADLFVISLFLHPQVQSTTFLLPISPRPPHVPTSSYRSFRSGSSYAEDRAHPPLLTVLCCLVLALS